MSWMQKKVTSNVLFKIRDMEPFKMFGEKECLNGKPNPVQIVAAAPNTRLVLLH